MSQITTASPVQHDEPKSQLNTQIPEPLFKALRIRCIEEGIEVRKAVATALRLWLGLDK